MSHYFCPRGAGGEPRGFIHPVLQGMRELQPGATLKVFFRYLLLFFFWRRATARGRRW